MGYELIFVFVLGLAIGSFLNVLIDRLPAGQGIGGRSHCDSCKRILSWIELVPVVSWFVQRGLTKCCGKKLSFYYPFVEAVTGLAFVFTWYSLHSLTSLILISALIGIFFTDIKYRIIPDYLTLVVILIGLYTSVASSALVSNVFAGLILFCIMFAIFVATKGKGMGFGDVKFAFAMGLVLGLVNGFLALYISFLLGGIVGGIMLLASRMNLKSSIAFGPFLVAGTVIMVFFDFQILSFIQTYIY